MRIGLLTVYFADYGSYCHSTALYDQLIKMGHQVELIHESFRYKSSLRLLAGSAGSWMLPAKVNRLLSEKYASYNTYLILKKDIAKLSVAKPTLHARKRYASYDCVVVGSDEQWSITNRNALFIPDCFGFGIVCPHISYATSGITMDENRVDSKQKQRIIDGLNTFTRLSVRDNTTKTWVEKWLQKPGACKQVLDPTLLNPYFVQTGPTQPVVVVYGEHFSKEQKNAVVQYARTKGYQMIAISWPHKWCDTFLEASCSQDVQKAFGQAAYCAVSTFHGTIFSILAHRPFVSFITELRGAKIQALLSELGLTERLYNDDMKGELPEEEINYEAVEQILAKRREDSLQYLSDALKQIEEKVY